MSQILPMMILIGLTFGHYEFYQHYTSLQLMKFKQDYIPSFKFSKKTMNHFRHMKTLQLVLSVVGYFITVFSFISLPIFDYASLEIVLIVGYLLFLEVLLVLPMIICWMIEKIYQQMHKDQLNTVLIHRAKKIKDSTVKNTNIVDLIKYKHTK